MPGLCLRFNLRSRPARFLVAAMALLTLGLAFTSQALASHNRATQLSWTKGSGAHDAEFKVSFVARGSYYGSPAVGNTIHDPTLAFGDGSSDTPYLTVVATDSANDVIYTEGHVSHTYANDGPFRATMGSCCRLSPSSGHVNNGDRNYQVHTLVDLVHATSSPTIPVSAIVSCPTSGPCSFSIPASSSSGSTLSYRFATSTETGDSGFVQPGPPMATNAATIDSTSGRYTWNTAGATVNSSGPTYYSTQVVVEEKVGNNTVSEGAADFFISLDDNARKQPDCVDTDGNGTADNDGDGLCDNWETTGIDVNHDGQIDFVPPNADPNHKDVYTEVDFMKGRDPQLDALGDVKAAYASHGINLHISLGDEVPFSEHLAFAPGCGSSCPSNTADFDALKDQFFGTAADRAASNSAARLEARSFVYHYVLYGNQLPGSSGSSGKSELPGNDLTVTLGHPSWRTGLLHHGPPTRRTEAGTFMHELGHNLDLRHGGGDDVNCKPNYISVMNYTRQTPGVVSSAGLDYSDQALPALDENNLDESLGIQGPKGVEIAFGPGTRRIANAFGPIDWNGTGAIQSGVSGDVNFLSNVPGCNTASSGGVDSGYNDWANLQLAFQATADFADGVHSSVFFQAPDVAADDVAAEDSDGDGTPNIQDSCPTAAGPASRDGCAPPAPQDGDGDGVPDSSDSCPTVAGPADSNGCPATPPPPGDLDGDTVLDPQDGCPDQPGPVSNQGCPIPVSIPRSDVDPPQTRIVSRKKLTFRFKSSEAGSTFQCKMDKGRWRKCKSPKKYKRLSAGNHTFRVRARDLVGNLDLTPAKLRFKVVKK
jgi:hypothetical protein